MTNEQFFSAMDKLRKKQPANWVAIIANGKIDTLARRLCIPLDMATKLKHDTLKLPWEEYVELRRHASIIRKGINKDTGKA